MIAHTEEFVFHRENDLQWRFGILAEGHSKTLTNSEKYEQMSKLLENGYVIVRQEASGNFVMLGREVEVDLDPVEA